MTRRCTTEEFIDKANLVHCNKYTYDLVEYKGNKVKVTITCPIHGNFYKLHLIIYLVKAVWSVLVKSAKLRMNL